MRFLHLRHISDRRFSALVSVLLAVNEISVERMPLPEIVELFEGLPRPLTITLSRPLASDSERAALQHMPSAVNGSSTTNSHSLSFDMSFNPFEEKAGSAGNSADDNEGPRPGKVIKKYAQLDLTCRSGIPNGIDLVTGVGGAAVVDNVDYDLLVHSMQSTTADLGHDIPKMIAKKELPLPGTILLAVDGKEMLYEEISDRLTSNELSRNGESFTLTFIESDSSSWGSISNFEAKVSLALTLIDDTSGRDMPVIRASLNGTSFFAHHGLGVATKAIHARRPLLLCLNQAEGTDSPVLTLESEIASLSIEYNNAIINHWEPILEPHYFVASIERQCGNGIHPGQCSMKIRDHPENTQPDPVGFICLNVRPFPW